MTYGGANDDRYHLTSTSPFCTSSWASEVEEGTEFDFPPTGAHAHCAAYKLWLLKRWTELKLKRFFHSIFIRPLGQDLCLVTIVCNPDCSHGGEWDKSQNQTFLPDVSPESVTGKTMVLLLISTRAWGACGVCWFLVASLVTDSIGVATWGGRADRVVSAGAADTSRARSRRIWTLINWPSSHGVCHHFSSSELKTTCMLRVCMFSVFSPSVARHTGHKSVHSTAVEQI